jgi:hypothetical protein
MKYLILGPRDRIVKVRATPPVSPDIKSVEVSDVKGKTAQSMLDDGLLPVWVNSTVVSKTAILATNKRLEWNYKLGKLVLIELEEVVKNPLQSLADQGVEIEPDVVLGASSGDKEQWTALQVHLDGKHEQISKTTGLTWEQIRGDFNSQPLTVIKKDGTPWVTTIGKVREAIVKVGDAYLAAWLASK